MHLWGGVECQEYLLKAPLSSSWNQGRKGKERILNKTSKFATEEDQALLQLLLPSLQILKLLIFPEFTTDGSKVEVSISVAKLSALAQQSPVQTENRLSAPRGHGGLISTKRHTLETKEKTQKPRISIDDSVGPQTLGQGFLMPDSETSKDFMVELGSEPYLGKFSLWLTGAQVLDCLSLSPGYATIAMAFSKKYITPLSTSFLTVKQIRTSQEDLLYKVIHNGKPLYRNSTRRYGLAWLKTRSQPHLPPGTTILP